MVSEEGRGSEFHFTLKLRAARVPSADQQAATQASLRGLRVLVVDDNATNRRILDDTLSRWEMRPLLATGGEDALAILGRACEERAPIPLVVSDVHMPGMDGFGLIAKIREIPALAGTRILILTSGARLDEAARCRDLGIITSLTKPVARAELLDAILLVLNDKPELIEPVHAPAAEPHHSAIRKPRVLVAEDHLANQKLAELLLKRHGYDPVVVSNGHEALEALSNGDFDAVLMDEQMPGMSGMEATAVIREREKISGEHMPVIAVTANAMVGDREKYLRAGMDAYISKPIRIRELIEVLGAFAPSNAAGV